MNPSLRWILQAAAYAAFAALLGYLSQAPAYDYAPADRAVIKVSLSHATQRVEPCVRLTPQEIAQLSPNMRREFQCERKRLPLVFELDVDGETVMHVVAQPSGLWNDGPASVYRRLELVPGRHRVSARLRDSDREQGWDFTHEETVSLEAGRYFTVTFHAETEGFYFR